MKKPILSRIGILTVAASLGLSACGGSSGSSAGPPAGATPSSTHAPAPAPSGNLASTDCTNTFYGVIITGLGSNCSDVASILFELTNNNNEGGPGTWQPTTGAVGNAGGMDPYCTWPNGGAIYDPGSSGEAWHYCQLFQQNHTVANINTNPNGG
jgi:hypothetical protein